MKIIITGALGHIGSFLIRDLPHFFEDCHIVMLDNFRTQRYASLFDLPKGVTYEFIEADITKNECEQIFSKGDVVVHLAAITDAASSFNNAEEVENINFNGTASVAQCCINAGIPLIHASSTSVYGTQDQEVSENCPLSDLKPQSPYAETKLREEEYLRQLVTHSGLKAVSLRFGTIFGISPGMRFHTAVNKFSYQASMGVPLTVWSTAYNQKRPYLDLTDCSRSVAHVINNKLYGGEIYNVNTLNATVKEVVDLIKIYKSNLKIDFVEHKIMNQLSYDVSNVKFKSTGFEFNGDLEARIGETMNLLRQANTELANALN